MASLPKYPAPRWAQPRCSISTAEAAPECRALALRRSKAHSHCHSQPRSPMWGGHKDRKQTSLSEIAGVASRSVNAVASVNRKRKVHWKKLLCVMHFGTVTQQAGDNQPQTCSQRQVTTVESGSSMLSAEPDVVVKTDRNHCTYAGGRRSSVRCRQQSTRLNRHSARGLPGAPGCQ